jgi:hypothetical protein
MTREGKNEIILQTVSEKLLTQTRALCDVQRVLWMKSGEIPALARNCNADKSDKPDLPDTHGILEDWESACYNKSIAET